MEISPHGMNAAENRIFIKFLSLRSSWCFSSVSNSFKWPCKAYKSNCHLCYLAWCLFSGFWKLAKTFLTRNMEFSISCFISVLQKISSVLLEQDQRGQVIIIVWIHLQFSNIFPTRHHLLCRYVTPKCSLAMMWSSHGRLRPTLKSSLQHFTYGYCNAWGRDWPQQQTCTI